MADSIPLLVILGPTASGKSSLALELARRTGAQILSVDSMQVYRGMDIGTAKPSPAERNLVRHHAIDLVDPNEVFTVARFVELADEVIRTALQSSVPLIATGGTPLYYKALFEGLFEGPPADPNVRDRLRPLSGEELARRLAVVDPEAAARIHPNDSKRLIRALEVFESTGRPISSFQTDWSSG
ncbi:MAG TPA: tRNA (adenosine(37)-N6)-dimethylallyltransferase MiaA, partial [Tepidisphaeraceae bacterium]|nr:tRNA (adenosine(37)-N6)-dimethylallyltransferase MiaA [Tepidisphaeraceae bacterium]